MPGGTGAPSLVLAPGDLIDLEVFNTPELSAPRLRIATDGTVVVPVVGSIKVGGLTPGQADAVVEQRLRDAQIMSAPSVTVLVLDYSSQGIDVLGEVRAPGIYPFLGTHTLYDALAAAGGVSATQGATIVITHHDDPAHPLVLHVGEPRFSEVQSSTMLQPGDVVEVSRPDTFFVVGDVLKSGQFPITNGKSVSALDALAMAQGPNKTAKLTRAAIVRKTPTGGAQLIPVDLHQIAKAEIGDPILLPDDVLVIPRSGAKAFFEIALPGATAAVVAALAYGFIR